VQPSSCSQCYCGGLTTETKHKCPKWQHVAATEADERTRLATGVDWIAMSSVAREPCRAQSQYTTADESRMVLLPQQCRYQNNARRRRKWIPASCSRQYGRPAGRNRCWRRQERLSDSLVLAAAALIGAA
jgi:hypothetical protein